MTEPTIHHPTLCKCERVDRDCPALSIGEVVVDDWLTVCPKGGEHEWVELGISAGIRKTGAVCVKCSRRRVD